MPNAAKKPVRDDDDPVSQNQVEQTSSDRSCGEDFDMEQMDDMEDMAALLIEALTIPLPVDSLPEGAEDGEPSTEDETKIPSRRQLQ